MNVSLKSARDRGDARAARRCSWNLRANVCDVHAGGRRRRSRPSSRSFSQRTGALRATAFESGANRLPQRDSPCTCPSMCARSGRAVATPVVGEKLALESRHVDAHGTFGLAGAALEAQIEHLPHPLVAEPRFAEPSRHRQPQHVRTSPRRVRLLPRRHVRRAHRPVAASCGTRRGRCTSRPRRAGRRARNSRRTSPAAAARYAGPYRRLAVSGGASTILPGLKMPCGSKVCLMCRNAW